MWNFDIHHHPIIPNVGVILNENKKITYDDKIFERKIRVFYTESNVMAPHIIRKFIGKF